MWVSAKVTAFMVLFIAILHFLWYNFIRGREYGYGDKEF